MMAKHVGRALRQALKASRFDAGAIAHRSKVSRHLMAAALVGSDDLRVETLVRIADALDCDVKLSQRPVAPRAVGPVESFVDIVIKRLKSHTSQPQSPSLFVSLFGGLDRRNFPPGRFARLPLSASEAKLRIDKARAAGTLFGVSDVDLAVDGKALSRARELLDALSALQSPIVLGLEDFRRNRHFVPLAEVAVGPSVELLVVSCAYEAQWIPSFSLSIGGKSISFDLFSAVV